MKILDAPLCLCLWAHLYIICAWQVCVSLCVCMGGGGGGVGGGGGEEVPIKHVDPNQTLTVWDVSKGVYVTGLDNARTRFPRRTFDYV